MIVECPHCFTKVAPAADGICPACRENVHDKPSEGADQTSMAVRHLTDLPGICCGCGQSTDRYVKISRKISHQKEQDSSIGALFILGLLFGWLFWIIALFRGAKGNRVGDVVIVEMPQCPGCQANGKPEPIRVNAEELQMTFVVHRELQARYAAAREAAE